MPTISIALSNIAARRLRDALTESTNSDDPATLGDVKAYIIADLKQLIQTSEKRIAALAAVSGTDPTIS